MSLPNINFYIEVNIRTQIRDASMLFEFGDLITTIERNLNANLKMSTFFFLKIANFYRVNKYCEAIL